MFILEIYEVGVLFCIFCFNLLIIYEFINMNVNQNLKNNIMTSSLLCAGVLTTVAIIWPLVLLAVMADMIMINRDFIKFLKIQMKVKFNSFRERYRLFKNY